MAASDRTRVYITDESECPPDAVLREGERGALYYVSQDRGQHGAVGGPHVNELLDLDAGDLDKRMTPDEIEEFCEPCAEKMREAGIRELKLKNAPAEIFKPFGPYDSMEDCMEDNQDADDPGAYCAQIHYEITGEWPSEKEEDSMSQKIFIASKEEAPTGVEVKGEENGRLFYEKDEAWANARATYSEDTEEELEEETDVDLNEAEGAGDGTPDESEFDEQLADLRDRMHGEEEAEAIPVYDVS